MYHAIACLRSYQNYHISESIRKSARRGHCTRAEQQQIFDSDLKGAWHNNHVTFTPIAHNFMLYCRLIYMLFILCVRLTIKVKVRIPESFKVRWYPPQKNWVESRPVIVSRQMSQFSTVSVDENSPRHTLP